MKKLHELLREYITRSGYTIYGLAKESGLNRSTLQKIVLGNMRLSREEMDRILPYLRLTRAEQEHFAAMQELGEKGELVRRRREAMAEFLVDVSEQIYEGMSAEGEDAAEGEMRCGEKEETLPRQKAGTDMSGQTESSVKNVKKPDISNTCNTPESVTLLRGKTEIQRSLIRCIAYEYERNGAGKIYASIPADWQFFYTELRAADRIVKKAWGGGAGRIRSARPKRSARCL